MNFTSVKFIQVEAKIDLLKTLNSSFWLYLDKIS